jgi:hypothetical protein
MNVRSGIALIILVCVSLLSHPARAQFSQQGPKLVGTGGFFHNPGQGFSVSISSDGNTAIVGGPEDRTSSGTNRGAAWVWTRTGEVWTQQGPKLVGSFAIESTYQGISVGLSADGNTAIVGGYGDLYGIGAAWIWTRNGGVWTQEGPKLVGAGASGNALQGTSVALSADGNTAIVGGPRDNGGVGAVWIWTRSGDVWTQQGPKLSSSGASGNAHQGYSVALSADGNTAIVGAWCDSSAGAAWVWTRSAGVWIQQGSKLAGSGARGRGQPDCNTFGEGSSVSLSADGNTAIVGEPKDASSGFEAIGAAWIWTRSGEVWTQQGPKLVGSGSFESAYQGTSVSLSADGNVAIVGGPTDDRGTGAAWLWTRRGGVWTQQGEKLVGTGVSNPFLSPAGQGTSVAMSGDGHTAIVGGYGDNFRVGAAWIMVARRVRAVRR